MAEKVNTAVRNRQADSLGNGTFDGGTLKIYTGSQPASANDAASGTLLVTITLPTPAFAAASGGEAVKAGTWAAAAGATGTAGWFRIEKSGLRLDGSVTGTGGGGEIELTSTSITATATITVANFKIVQPAS